MFLLDTPAVADLVSGKANAIRRRVERAERQKHAVKASVVSFGLLKASIVALQDPSVRDIWERRFEVARREMRLSGNLLMVTEACAIEFAFVNHLDLFRRNGQGNPDALGDAERLVVATAISEGFALLTGDARGYADAVQHRNLIVEEV